MRGRACPSHNAKTARPVVNIRSTAGISSRRGRQIDPLVLWQTGVKDGHGGIIPEAHVIEEMRGERGEGGMLRGRALRNAAGEVERVRARCRRKVHAVGVYGDN